MSVPDDWSPLDIRAVDTVRVLAADAVQRCGSGHPGDRDVLWRRWPTRCSSTCMRHDPSDPGWQGRDRFVLSCGHSSLTLYLQLFLSGYGMELSDLEQLRTWGSQTPGHPEYGHTPGVEITTGPLGPGSRRGRRYGDGRPSGAWSVRSGRGARREPVRPRRLRDRLGRRHRGGRHLARRRSIAGRQQLGNLVVIYDDNHISIEDDTTIALSEDVAMRYEAYGWHVQTVRGRRERRRHPGGPEQARRPRPTAPRSSRYGPSSASPPRSR